MTRRFRFGRAARVRRRVRSRPARTHTPPSRILLKHKSKKARARLFRSEAAHAICVSSAASSCSGRSIDRGAPARGARLRGVILFSPETGRHHAALDSETGRHQGGFAGSRRPTLLWRASSWLRQNEKNGTPQLFCRKVPKCDAAHLERLSELGVPAHHDRAVDGAEPPERPHLEMAAWRIRRGCLHHSDVTTVDRAAPPPSGRTASATSTV